MSPEELEEFKQKYFSSIHCLYKGPINTKAEIKNFVVCAEVYKSHLHRLPTPDIMQRIWYDLIHSKHAKNLYSMKLPFLLRISSDKRGRNVLTLSAKQIDSCGFPSNLNKHGCIGLYSANIDLLLSGNAGWEDHKDLWPDIQPVLSELSPPGCVVGLYFSQITFVSVASEKEMHAMECKPKTISQWFDDMCRRFNSVGE